MVLLATLVFLGHWWTANLLYTGIAAMVGVSVWDLIAPAHRRCGLGVDNTSGADALVSTLTCPQCGFAKQEIMPTDACQFFYECGKCKAMLRPKSGDCCVYCSYGTRKCSPQQQHVCCG